MTDIFLMLWCVIQTMGISHNLTEKDGVLSQRGYKSWIYKESDLNTTGPRLPLDFSFERNY